MSALFFKKLVFFVQKSTFTQSSSVRAVLKIFLVLFSVFVRQKVAITENITFADSVSGIRSPDCSKLAKNPKNDNDVTISQHDVFVKFFWPGFVSLVKFSYWSKFHVNSITGSGIMTIFFCKRLTRNPEIGNTSVWVLPNIWGKLWIPNLAWMSLIECYWMLQNSRVTAFTVFELLRENQLGGK